MHGLFSRFNGFANSRRAGGKRDGRRSSGTTPQTTQVWTGLEPLEARVLLSTGGVSGVVLAHDTLDPLPGIWVNVFQSSDPEHASDDAWDFVSSDLTDAAGQYEVSGLPERHSSTMSSKVRSSVGTHS